MPKYFAYEWRTKTTILLFTDHPRKELLHELGKKSAKCMYVDSKDSKKRFRVGWIIDGRWFRVYSVCEMRVEV